MSHDNTLALISLALDAALMRQTAIASNVANANTRDYRTQSVNFEEQLGYLPASGESPLEKVKPFYQQDAINSSLDEQMALSVKNATQYRALIKGLNHKLAIMKMAVQGNSSS